MVLLDILSGLDDEKLLTTEEVANLFQVGTLSIREWVESGRLTYEYRVGKGPMRFSKKNLLDFFHAVSYESKGGE